MTGPFKFLPSWHPCQQWAIPSKYESKKPFLSEVADTAVSCPSFRRDVQWLVCRSNMLSRGRHGFYTRQIQVSNLNQLFRILGKFNSLWDFLSLKYSYYYPQVALVVQRTYIINLVWCLAHRILLENCYFNNLAIYRGYWENREEINHVVGVSHPRNFSAASPLLLAIYFINQRQSWHYKNKFAHPECVLRIFHFSSSDVPMSPPITIFKEKSKPAAVSHAFNPSSWVAEAGGFQWVYGQPGLQCKFQDSQEC